MTRSLYRTPILSPTYFSFFFFNDTATTEIYTLSLHDALPISVAQLPEPAGAEPAAADGVGAAQAQPCAGRRYPAVLGGRGSAPGRRPARGPCRVARIHCPARAAGSRRADAGAGACRDGAAPPPFGSPGAHREHGAQAGR